MQDQEFITEQNSENLENQESVNAAPEIETQPNFNVNAVLPEQETVVFSPPSQNFADAPKSPQMLQTISTGEEELFEKYEIKNWEFTPRFYKIFAFSAVFTTLFLVTVAQTDVLRTKACDSPLVGGFCQVLDTLYVGSKIIGSDDEFVSKDYEKTEIADADIVWLDKTGMEPPLTYPAGYFQISNPEMFPPEGDPLNPANLNDPNFPSIVNIAPPMPNPSSPNPIMPRMPAPRNNSIFNRPQKLPKARKNAIPNDLPDGIVLPGDENQAEIKEPKNPSKENTAANKDKNEEKEKPKQNGLETLPVADDIINKKPLQDFGNEVLDKVGNKQIDLTKAFSVVMVGTITDDGKFDQKKSAYLKSSGDQAMIDTAKSAIEAIGDSGILTYLKRLDVNQIKFELVQNDKEIYAIITSDQKSVPKASSVATGLNFALGIGRSTVKEEDTLALLNAAKVESKEKTFILNFNLEKAIAQQLIKRQLDKAEAKRKLEQQTKPNSTAQTVNKNENTSR